MDSGQSKTYDLAVSFAGEDRDYVEQTVGACGDLGLRVFYDRDMGNEWWGKNFIREQRKVYGSQARYFVPFISTEYLCKADSHGRVLGGHDDSSQARGRLRPACPHRQMFSGAP